LIFYEEIFFVKDEQLAAIARGGDWSFWQLPQSSFLRMWGFFLRLRGILKIFFENLRLL
jgi:hypothetical protein